jgi:DNA replication protein DnaC
MKPLRDLLPNPNDGSRAIPPISSSAEEDGTAACRLCGTATALCGGLGFIRVDVPVEHPDFGKPIRCPNYQPSDDVQRVEKLRALSNLDNYAHCRFETFNINPPGLSGAHIRSLQHAANSAYHYAHDMTGWLMLYGGYGCGKTHLAAAIGHERIARGDLVLFVTVPDLLDHLRSTYGPSSEVGYDELFNRMREAPLLILDDLGAENPSPWAREKLYQLLNHRYSLRLPTIITTNVEVDLLDPRLRSRLMDTYLVRQITIDAPDFRNASASLRDPVSDLTLYADMRFDNFDLRTNVSAEEMRSLSENLEVARQYAAQPSRWLVWMGTYHGCGKTHLAAAIGNAAAENGTQVVFLTVPDLLDKLRRSYGSASSPGYTPYDRLFNIVRDAELLILDDLGAQNETNWGREKLFQILNHRYVTVRPTVITTGVKKLGELDYRIVTWLIDQRRCIIRQINARDYAGRLYSRGG